MTSESWTIIGCTIAVVAAFGVYLVPTLRGIQSDLTDIGRRVARIEGLIEGMGRSPETVDPLRPTGISQ